MVSLEKINKEREDLIKAIHSVARWRGINIEEELKLLNKKISKLQNN